MMEKLIKSKNDKITKPSAPILPRPVTRNTSSTSHQSKLVGELVQICPNFKNHTGNCDNKEKVTFNFLTFLTSQRWCNSDHLLIGNGILNNFK